MLEIPKKIKYHPRSFAANNSFHAFVFVLEAKIKVIVPRIMLTKAEMASKERKSEYIGYDYSKEKTLKILFVVQNCELILSY